MLLVLLADIVDEWILTGPVILKRLLREVGELKELLQALEVEGIPVHLQNGYVLSVGELILLENVNIDRVEEFLCQSSFDHGKLPDRLLYDHVFEREHCVVLELQAA